MKKTKIIVAIALALALTGGILAFLIPNAVATDAVTESEMTWAKEFLRGTLTDPTVLYNDFLEGNKGTATPSFSETVPSAAAELTGGETAEYRVTVPQTGLYSLTLDCGAKERSFVNITLAVAVNGETQYSEANNIDVPLFWKDSTKDFPLDSFGDESVPSVDFVGGSREIPLYNNTYLTTSPILFRLEGGENVISITNKSVRALLTGGLTVTSDTPLTPYAEYRQANGGEVVPGIMTVDATSYAEKNSTFIQLVSSNDIGASPSDPVKRMVNVVGFGEVGSEAAYELNIEKTGYYALALHAGTQSDDFPSFCTIKVDGAIPFAEAAAFPIRPGSSNGWINAVFGSEDGEPYYLYLEQGTHTLSFRPEAEPMAVFLRDLRLLVEHINQFSLNVKKVAGKEVDKNRTWRLTRYMPETEDTLKAYNILLRGLLNGLGEFSEKGINASTLSGLMEAIGLMEKLSEEPDDLPLYLENLSGEQVSALKSCGTMLDSILSLSFSIDDFYLYDGVTELPRENPSFLSSVSSMGSQLWASFTSPKYAVQNDDEALNIWINSSVMLADTLQKLADTRFTPETGIKVKLSIMPDQNKLVLASAAGTQPDMALAIERHIPFDLALRDAIYDLTNFPDFWDVAGRFAPGALIPYIYNDGVYGLSESLDFQALVYREDILDSLGLEPPDTWYDVADMMSELQRFDMSFYMPIASGVGYKWFNQTSPLIYQFGGDFYEEDGTGTTINQPNAVKGITLLGDLFTTYALNEQVMSFFNAFRYGQTPVGITGNADYLLIKYGAPELTGQWKLAAPPGIPQEDGTVSRWFISNGRASTIFTNSDKKEEGWEFLKWWTSEDVQSEYAFTLLSQYGYIFLPGNLKALENSYLPDEDRAVILEAVKWLRDVPRSPGQYMLERMLSDIWNEIVFEGIPPQVSIDMNVITIQREFRRKMLEFGYADEDGNLIQPYAVRELDWVLEQLAAHGSGKEASP
ncbi:MAG: extracellular solute-binding protein [Oscillospiraceae bacterium]|nr:extracellular solute-binding protein [Oscillospiraceae bacterium]